MSLTPSRWAAEEEKDDENQNTWSLYQKTHLWNSPFLFYAKTLEKLNSIGMRGAQQKTSKRYRIFLF